MVFKKGFSKSELVKLINTTKKSISNIGKKARSLSKKEKELLIQNGNFSLSWQKVKVCGRINLENIRNNIFIGNVIISKNDPKPKFEEISLPCGIFNSTIEDSIIDENVLIKDTKLLKNYYVGPDALIINNGIITSDEFPLYANAIEIPVGIETGGRDIQCYSELTIEEASKIALNRNDKKLLGKYADFVKKYTEKIKFKKAIILKGAKILNNKEIKNTLIGNSAIVSGATSVKNTTILSNESEITELKDGVYVVDSIVQWGCEVSSMAIVASSVLTEHSHVERHGKVTNSIIGPNTGIAEGEITASLVGPFVGFHHQALLIAAVWPEGKGNVGYGANVGSNHTSKAPDQEIFPGEGLFFGLGVNIKFPANFTKAPYTIIATGVITLPQKVEFPFSLINSPAASIRDVSPAYNEIIPAWVLSDNIFAIKRNEGKYKKRNKAKRTEFIFDVFRPETVDLMTDARDRLLGIKEHKEVYLDKDIKGIGKNYLSDKNRLKAVDIYTFYIKYYALGGLKNKVISLLAKGAGKVDWDMLEKKTNDARWEHEKNALKKEFSGITDIKELLAFLVEMEEKITLSVKASKEKDDIRGRKISDDYDYSHTLAADDSFVKETNRELEELKKEIIGLQRKII